MILSFKELPQANPLRQFVLVAILAAVCMVLTSVLSRNPEAPWFVGSASLGFYVWVNAVLAFFNKGKWLVYIGWSFVLFWVLLTAIILFATLLSGISLLQLPEYQPLFAATFIFYSCGIVVCTIIRNVAKLMEIHY